MNLNDLAHQCLANSQRWFPELHDTPRRAAMHFLVGYVGEFGEMIECLPSTTDRNEEAADCAIYLMDLAAILGVDLGDVEPFPLQAAQGAVAIGRIANLVKKWNRSADLLDPGPGEKVGHMLRLLLGDLLAYFNLAGTTIEKQVDRKAAICEARWGKS